MYFILIDTVKYSHYIHFFQENSLSHSNLGDTILIIKHLSPRLVCIILFCIIHFLSSSRVKILANDGNNNKTSKDPKIVEVVKKYLDGFTIGEDTRFFPYVSLEDWFDPYLGTKLEHGTFWNQTDRMFHHIKIENFTEFSWKFRYQANSISSENTKLSILFKTKMTDDDYYYGIGDTTLKKNRFEVDYFAYFIGGEIQQSLSKTVLLRWSAGLWNFNTGLKEGGEFEKASDAQYVTSRFTFSDKKSADYWKASTDHQWSIYLETGLPVHSSVSSYARLNYYSYTHFRLFTKTRIGIGNRIEFLIAKDRELVPYFALPEVGSRSGLRGFSKERFRNFVLTALNLEYSFLFSESIEGFLLTDLVLTGSKPAKLFKGSLHQSFGVGFRFQNTSHPFTLGFAAGKEGWKLFSSIAVGSPW